MKLLTTSLVALFLLTSCSSTNVNYERYTLVEGLDSNQFARNYDLLVTVAPVLDEGGIVLKTSPVTLRAANNHLWTSDIKAQLGTILMDKMRTNSVRNNLNIQMYVGKFYGSSDGTTFIDLTVNIKKKDKTVFNKSYYKEGKQSADGYDALVENLKDNYIEICQEISLDLVNLD